MTENFMAPILKCLERVLDDVLAAGCADRVSLEKDLKLRPPKKDAWGDLCTNVVLLLRTEDGQENIEIAAKFVDAFQNLPMIRAAKLSDAGYINLHIHTAYWGTQLPLLLSEGTSFGLANGVAPIVLGKPDDIDGLCSARQQWNIEALQKLADLSHCPVVFEPWHPSGSKGFSSVPAIAKCTENTLRYALLATGDDFAIHFSPVLATDKAYSNPAFCIPFAHARLQSLLSKAAISSDGAGQDLVLTEAIDDIYLNLPIEQKIAKFLCEWPIAVEQSIKNRDVVHLVTFLHDLSLLVFRLIDQEKVQSSDYLTVREYKTARKLLLKAIDTVICGGVEILGIDIVEEFI